MDSPPLTPVAFHICCEDRRLSAAGPFSGGTKEAKPTEIRHIFQFSSLSDTPRVSTLRTPHWQRNNPPSLKSFNSAEARAGVCLAALAAPRRNRRGGRKTCAPGAASRCDAARKLPVFWRRRQFLSSPRRPPSRAPPIIAASNPARNRIAHIGQATGLGARGRRLTAHRDR